MVFKFFNNRNLQRFELWLHRASVSQKLFYGLVLAAFGSGFATYISFVKGGSSDLILNLIILNVVVLISLVLLIATRLIKIFVSRRQGTAGARFHSRLVMVFSFLAITPTLVIYFMSSALFERGVQALVGQFTHDVVHKSLEFSNNVKENLKLNMENLAKEITQDIHKNYPNILEADPESQSFLSQLHHHYGLGNLVVLCEPSNIIFSTSSSDETTDIIRTSNTKIWDNLRKGFFTVYFSSDNKNIIAGYPINLEKKLYLFISQSIDPFLPQHFYEIKEIYKRYQDIQQNRWQIRFIFMTVYGLFAVLSLLIAIGIGILLADHISQPISQLIIAAQRIRKGNLDTRIKIEPNIVEFLGLAKAFNLMVKELQEQKTQLESASTDVQRRKNFIETTLKGLSSGVVGLDETNHIQVINDAAAHLLGMNSSLSNANIHIADVLPELKDLLYENSEAPANDDILSKRSHKLIVTEREGKLYYLSINISYLGVSNDVRKVLTIDDMTELHLAQRKAAWGDVARRVAHEIKNPLTPIQLSAERLKRKLSKLLPADEQAKLSTNIETIIRQVGEIERIVKEFSQLSRMPQPILHENDVLNVLRNAVNLQKNAYDAIKFKETYPKKPVMVLCDDQLLGQALSNILKNSIESLLELKEITKFIPTILILLTVDGKNVTIKILDNGKGFPTNMIDKFLEPYVTTKKTGTGLGLAITKKIIDDHNGTLTLKNLDHQGAEVTITLPLHQ